MNITDQLINSRKGNIQLDDLIKKQLSFVSENGCSNIKLGPWVTGEQDPKYFPGGGNRASYFEFTSEEKWDLNERGYKNVPLIILIQKE